MPGGSAALAGGEAATEVPLATWGAAAACRGGAAAAKTTQRVPGYPLAGGGGPEASGELRRVVTQQTASRDFLRPSRLL